MSRFLLSRQPAALTVVPRASEREERNVQRLPTMGKFSYTYIYIYIFFFSCCASLITAIVRPQRHRSLWPSAVARACLFLFLFACCGSVASGCSMTDDERTGRSISIGTTVASAACGAPMLLAIIRSVVRPC